MVDSNGHAAFHNDHTSCRPERDELTEEKGDIPLTLLIEKTFADDAILLHATTSDCSNTKWSQQWGHSG